MPRTGAYPRSTKAWCACGDFGTQSQPRLMMAVLGHRKHAKTPECVEPPYVVGADGEVTRADYPVKPPPPEEEPPLEPLPEPAVYSGAQGWEDTVPDPAPPPLREPWPGALGGPAPPPPPPRGFTGKASVPAPDPKALLGTPAPVFAPTKVPQFSAAVFHLFDWSVQQGYGGEFDRWAEEAIRGYFYHRFGKAVAIVDVGDAA